MLVNRLFSSIAAIALVASLHTVAVAATSASAPALVAVSTTCPAGETYVKAYTKSDGTVVHGYCRKSTAVSCPKGETWVMPYTKSNGTMIKGHCRKSPA